MSVPLVPVSAPAASLVDALDATWARGAAALLLPEQPAAGSSAPALPAAVTAAVDGAAVLPGGAAVVVLTSGSTGAPRGVVLGHEALARAVEATIERLGCARGERWALALPTHHVAGLMVVLRARALGTAPLVVDRPGDAAALLASADGGATHLALVPAQLARLVTTGARLDRFRTLLVGGGPAPEGLVDAARDAGGRVVTSYGMTETCGGCVHDGIPLDGMEVDVGADGRIRLRGPMLASGYLGASSAAFGADGWFTTQDRGRISAGRLVIEGRADDVIVSGGANVAASAVTTALLAHPTVEDALVLGRDDAEWGRLVVAVIVPRDPSSPPTLADLRDHVRRTLPPEHAPRALVITDTIVRDALGKVPATERARLLEADTERR